MFQSVFLFWFKTEFMYHKNTSFEVYWLKFCVLLKKSKRITYY